LGEIFTQVCSTVGLQRNKMKEVQTNTKTDEANKRTV